MSRALHHHQAPPVVDDIPPYLTPGTRVLWASVTDWIEAGRGLFARRITSRGHVTIADHLDELARHPGFLTASTLAELEALVVELRQSWTPPRGQRAGTSFERVINGANNAIAEWKRLDARELAVLEDTLAESLL